MWKTKSKLLIDEGADVHLSACKKTKIFSFIHGSVLSKYEKTIYLQKEEKTLAFVQID